MNQLADFVSIFLSVYMLCMFIWALLSWLPQISPGLAYNELVVSVRRFLDSIIMPWVGLFRAIPPLRAGGMMLDLSFLAAFAVLWLASGILPNLIRNLA